MAGDEFVEWSLLQAPNPYTRIPQPVSIYFLEIPHPTPSTRNQKPETRKHKSEIRNPKPETRNQKSKIRSPKPLARNQKPETRIQKSPKAR